MVDTRTSPSAPSVASQLELFFGYKLRQRRDTHILYWLCSDSISYQSYIWSPFLKTLLGNFGCLGVSIINIMQRGHWVIREYEVDTQGICDLAPNVQIDGSVFISWMNLLESDHMNDKSFSVGLLIRTSNSNIYIFLTNQFFCFTLFIGF